MDDLYIAVSESENIVKIGRSVNPELRLTTIRSEDNVPNDVALATIHKDKGDQEHYALLAWKAYRLHGEWFAYEGDLRK